MKGIIVVEATGKEIQAPLYNLNGSSPDTMFDSYYAAMKALQKAEEALRETTPHGRDYQTVNNGEYQRARSEHTARLQSIYNIVREVEALTFHAMNEAESRKKTT